MKPTLKQIEKWVLALRSEKYEQTRGLLNRQNDDGKNSYCCLGVACKVFVKKSDLELEINRIIGGEPSDQPAAPIWLKVISGDFKNKTSNFEFKGPSLIALNDSGYNDLDCFTFDEIADLLELVYIHEAFGEVV